MGDIFSFRARGGRSTHFGLVDFSNGAKYESVAEPVATAPSEPLRALLAPIYDAFVSGVVDPICARAAIGTGRTEFATSPVARMNFRSDSDTNGSQPYVSFLLPCYNEMAVIPETYRRIKAVA